MMEQRGTLTPDRNRNELEWILIQHQRRDIGSCLCGWHELGLSHPGHQADVILARWNLAPKPAGAGG